MVGRLAKAFLFSSDAVISCRFNLAAGLTPVMEEPSSELAAMSGASRGGMWAA